MSSRVLKEYGDGTDLPSSATTLYTVPAAPVEAKNAHFHFRNHDAGAQTVTITVDDIAFHSYEIEAGGEYDTIMWEFEGGTVVKWHATDASAVAGWAWYTEYTP